MYRRATCMKNKIVSLIKYFKWIYNIYFFVCSRAINILKIFIKPQNNLILFNSFGGRKYDDSPKALYEAMISDTRFENYKFVWAFHNPDNFFVERAEVIKTDTIKYFKTDLQARCWITNSGIERGLNFKGKKTFYFNTWHGTPIKKMGSDLSDSNKGFRSKAKSKIDIMTAQGDFEADIFSRVFNIPRERFLMCGLPRNDMLANYSDKERIKEKLGIPSDKKVILYAPTYREYERDKTHNCILKPPVDLKKWEEVIGRDFCMLLRAHYEVVEVMDVSGNDFVKDVSEYPCLNDLMIVADILISDYSSIFFDFSIMDKPMLHFTYDFEEYSSKRGMYFDIRNLINGGDNEEKLLDIIINIDEDAERELTRKFRDKYVNYYGNAIGKSLDCIAANIGGE